MAPILPPELCDGIIDCLFDDCRSLKQTALTCRSWLPRSRKHLFESVVLMDDDRSWKHFADCVGRPDSARPLVPCTQYVRHLTLFRWPMFSEDIFSPVLSMLHNVNTLTLDGYAVNELAENQKYCDYLAKSVTTLHLNHALLSSPDLVRSLLTKFTNLRALSLDAIVWPNTESLSVLQLQNGSSTSTQNPVSVEHLDLCCCRPWVISAISECLLNAPFVTRLRTLHVALDSLADKTLPKPISDLCRVSGTSFQELHVHWLQDKEITHVILPDLSQNHDLNRVHIHRAFDYTFAFDSKWLEDVLSQLQRVSFRELVIDLGFTYVSCLEVLDWPMIDTQLSRLAQSRPGLVVNFSTYVPVEFMELLMWPRWLDSDIITNVQNGLPKLGARIPGQVKVTFLRGSSLYTPSQSVPWQTFLLREHFIF